jgi:hypothetical protein
MIRRVLILVMLSALLTGGCVTIRMETKIKKDGSGTKSFVLAFNKSVMSMMESMADESGAGIDDIWATASEGAAAIPGATVKQFSDDESEGINVSVPFGSLEELEALSSNDTFEGTDSVSVSRDGDVTTMVATVNVGKVTSGFDEAGGQGLEGFDMGEFDFEYSYAVEVEGEILEYSPQDIATIDGSKVTWDLTRAISDTVALTLKWEPGGGLDLVYILLVAAAVGEGASDSRWRHPHRADKIDTGPTQWMCLARSRRH